MGVRSRLLTTGIIAALVIPSLPASATEPAEQAANGPDVVAVHRWAADGASCTLDPVALIGISRAVSNHGDIDGYSFDRTGTMTPALFGERQNGSRAGLAEIEDSDAGSLDADDEWDRPMGPMQFLPQTWEVYGRDANLDGVADPQNLWDASASAAALLCDHTDLTTAIRIYTGSDALAARAMLAMMRVRTDLMAEIEEAEPTTRDDVVVVEALSERRTASDLAEADIAPPSGDWDGDGVPGRAEWLTNDRGLQVVLLDDDGQPWGAPLMVDPGATPIAGDWDGDGADTLGVWEQQSETLVRYLDAHGEELRRIDGLPANATISTAPADIVETFRESGLDLRGPETVVASVSVGQAERVVTSDGTEIFLYNVNGIRVHEDIADPVEAMIAAAAEDGIALTGWGWRSHARQIELREAHCEDVYSTAPADCTPPTAYPGQSRHETGEAIDFHIDGVAIGKDTDVFRWLAENAETYGLFNLESEPWHWSVDGR